MDTEMEKKSSEQEAREQEGEEETSFNDNDNRHGDDSILIPDGSNPDFKRVDVEEDAGSYDNPLEENVIQNTKQFLKDVFDISVNKDDGSYSKKTIR